MKKFFSRRSKSSGATKFGEPSSPGEGKTGGGSRYPLKHTATNNNTTENSDDDDRPEGLPSNNDAGSKNNAPNPTLRMSRTKSQHISHGKGAGGLNLHGIWLAAFLADQNMINEILKDQPEMINERLRRADNKTPLMLSCQAGDPKVVELLISKGAKLDAVDVFGRTSLMLAAKYDFPEIIELLIKYNFLKNKDNSLVHALSENNLNALMIATDSGAMRAVQVIMNHGPDLEVSATGGEHLMRTVKDIVKAKINESKDNSIYATIQKLLNGEKIGRAFPKRSAAMRRRISGNGVVLFNNNDDGDSGKGRRK